jgi:hypothetical protein
VKVIGMMKILFGMHYRADSPHDQCNSMTVHPVFVF